MQPGGVLFNPKESSRTIKTFAVLTVSSHVVINLNFAGGTPVYTLRKYLLV